MVGSSSPSSTRVNRSRSRFVSRREVASTLVFLFVILLVVIPEGHAFVPLAFGAGAAVGPVAVYVQGRVLDDAFTEAALIVLLLAAVAVLAAVGFLSAMVWLLVGVNVGTLVLAGIERGLPR